MTYEIVRPKLGETKRKELERYLLDQWERVKDARSTQVDSDYDRWDKNYYALPKESRRTLPWPGASNFVVPIIRIFLDTFVARTLNVIMATKPLFSISGFPREGKEALQTYLDRKALCTWNYYNLTRDLLIRGNKNGTAIIKTLWEERSSFDVWKDTDGIEVEQEVIAYRGPRHYIVPFEDVAVYPVTANAPENVLIWFERVRFVEEDVRRRVAKASWTLTEEEIKSALTTPNDVKKERTQEEGGVVDYRLQELHAVECHLDYEISNEGKYYSIVGVIVPQLNKLVDVYFNPLPRNASCFTTYRPFPKEDFFYGESMCQILEQLQEETSTIHNDRRNNSYIANAPVFKRRSGSLLPNPSTNWYPGKVWDLEDMADFEVMSLGRNYDNMMEQEQYGMQLGERLSGIGSVQQGYGAGMMGKRGIYNASGTMAILAEGNQRQDTNVRDVRETLGELGRLACGLQASYDPRDPLIDSWPEPLQSELRAALQAATPRGLEGTRFEIKASSAGSNRETERQSLLQMSAVLEKHGSITMQLSQQLANPSLNQGLRLIINDIIKMQSWMASRLLRAWDEHDAEGILPDVKTAINAVIPGGGSGTSDAPQGGGEPGVGIGGPPTPGAGPSRTDLAALAALPGTPQ